MKRMLKLSEVAARCSVTTRTVRNWIYTGILPAKRAGERGAYLIDPDDLDRALSCSSAIKEKGKLE